jgi:hypothetical protein
VDISITSHAVTQFNVNVHAVPSRCSVKIIISK